MNVTTNHVPRPIVEAYELTATEQAEFDHLDWPAIERGEDSASFVRYKGELHDLGEFDRATEPGWDDIRPDSFFSALVVRYVVGDWRYPDHEYVVVGLALS